MFKRIANAITSCCRQHADTDADTETSAPIQVPGDGVPGATTRISSAPLAQALRRKLNLAAPHTQTLERHAMPQQSTPDAEGNAAQALRPPIRVTADGGLLRDTVHADVVPAPTMLRSRTFIAARESRCSIRDLRSAAWAASARDGMKRKEVILLSGKSGSAMLHAAVAALSDCTGGLPATLMIPKEPALVASWKRAANGINDMLVEDPAADIGETLLKYPEDQRAYIELLAIAKRCGGSVVGMEPIPDVTSGPAKQQVMVRQIDAECFNAKGPVVAMADAEGLGALAQRLGTRHCVSSFAPIVAPRGPDASGDPSLHEVARDLGVPTSGRWGPTIGKLAAECRARYDGWLIGSPDADVLARNEMAAEIVYKATRDHFKSGVGSGRKDGALKSSNKRYAPNSPIAKRAERESRRLYSFVTLQQTIGAWLEKRIEQRVGQCSDMAGLAVLLARNLGLTANMWKFGDAIDPHVFCVVGLVPSQEDASRPADRLDEHGRWQAPGLQVVDAWASVRCPGGYFLEKFKDKMKYWNLPDKLKQVGMMLDDKGSSAWFSPMSERWAKATFEGPVTKVTKKYGWGYFPE